MRKLFSEGKWWEYLLCGAIMSAPFLAILASM